MRLLILMATLLLTACQRTATVTPDLAQPERIAAGRVVYEQHCAACHGAQLEGQPDWTTRRADGRLPAPPHNDEGHTWHHPSELLFGIVKSGLVPPYATAGYVSDMPAFGKQLSDEQIWAVLAYIRSQWSAPVRERHDALEAEIQRRQPK